MILSRPALVPSPTSWGVTVLSPSRTSAPCVFTQIADTATTTPAGGTFLSLDTPSPSGGAAAFVATYTDGAGTSGIFASTGAGGALAAVATAGNSGVEGSAAPAGGTFALLGHPSLHGNTVAFFGNYTDGAGTVGIFANTGAGGALTAIATGGTGASAQVPGGGTFTGFGLTPSLSGSTIAFQASYAGVSGTQGIFVYTRIGGTLEAIATNGAGNNAVPGGGAFSTFGSPSLCGSKLAFSASFTGGNGTVGIFTKSGSDGALTTIATGGTGARAQVPTGGTFTHFGNPSISNQSTVFWAAYRGGMGTSGIFVSTGVDGALETVATNGTGSNAVPGGGTFTGFGATPSISGNKIAFVGSYTGGAGTSGIFLSSGGKLTTVLTTATPSPFGSTFTGFVLGTQGLDGTQLAFRYTLADGRSGIALATLAFQPAPETGILGFIALGRTIILVRRRQR